MWGALEELELNLKYVAFAISGRHPGRDAREAVRWQQLRRGIIEKEGTDTS